MDDGRLGRAVDVGPEAGVKPGDARRADDRARALSLHDGPPRAYPEEDTAEEHRDGRVEALDADLVDGAVDSGESRVC